MLKAKTLEMTKRITIITILLTGLFVFGVMASDARPAQTGNIQWKSIRNSFDFAFADIPAGSFVMGDSENGPIHVVSITKGFAIQQNEITQAQWIEVMGTNPSQHKNCNYCPVDSVTWDEVEEFIAKLNNRGEGTYRLPTEAEWEYAARAGTTTKYSFGNGSGIEKYAWYTGENTHEARTKQPNPWGLYDMHGNVSEWTSDWYGDYPSGRVTDPKGPARGTSKVYRGGGMGFDVNGLSSAARGYDLPEMTCSWSGFRLVMEENSAVIPTTVGSGRSAVASGKTDSEFLNTWAAEVRVGLPEYIAGFQLKTAWSRCAAGCQEKDSVNYLLLKFDAEGEQQHGDISDLEKDLKPALLTQYCKTDAVRRNIMLGVFFDNRAQGQKVNFWVSPDDCR